MTRIIFLDAGSRLGAFFTEAMKDSFRKLDPRIQLKNPVMFVTEVGALLSTIFVGRAWAAGHAAGFEAQIAAWLWFTVVFANFAEALKKTRSATVARRWKNGVESKAAAAELRKGDRVICEAGDVIPGDGDVVEGIATVDESAITGESAPVVRESGGDHSAVTGGTKVLSDRIVIEINAEPGHGFLDRMIALVEGASRQKTPNEIALTILLSGLTLIFLLTVISLKCFANYSGAASGQDLSALVNVPVLMALLVCLIPTTIGGLLSAIGISGMDRLIRRNVVATSGKAVETAGDIDVLLLDKTGTITLGNRMATEFTPAPGVQERELAQAAQWSSLLDETPEGRSIVVLAKEKFKLRAEAPAPHEAEFVPFSAQTRMSGVDFRDGRKLRKGAVEALRKYIEGLGGQFPQECQLAADKVAKAGATPLAVAEGNQVLGIVTLKDVVKGGIKERFAELRAMGIRTVMITGDNPLAAAAIAAEAGVDDFMAQAKPEDKLQRIREEQAKGHLVAMTGDGTNDAPALAQADYEPVGAGALLRRNLFIYGLGGVVAPFVGIKLLDMLIVALHWAA